MDSHGCRCSSSSNYSLLNAVHPCALLSPTGNKHYMSSRYAGTLQPGRRCQRLHLATLARHLGFPLPGETRLPREYATRSRTPSGPDRSRYYTAGGTAPPPPHAAAAAAAAAARRCGSERLPRVSQEAVLEEEKNGAKWLGFSRLVWGFSKIVVLGSDSARHRRYVRGYG